jgi:signal transduction histidine kinase/CheY-like chemotaxis protein/predicted RNA-binding protein with RPS1 domain
MIQDRSNESGEWADWAKLFPIGSNVAGTVLDVWQVGAHIQLDGGPQALLLNSEMSWDGFVPDARTLLHKGDCVKVQVLLVEQWRQRVYVSLRRTVHDPWKAHATSYKKGRTARARVTQFATREVAIEFEDHVDGFIPRAEIAHGSIRAEQILEIGDWVEVKVIDRDDRTREVKASMKLRLAEIEAEVKGEPIPAAEAEVPETAAGAQETVDEVAAHAGGSMPRILVVEDEAVQRLQLRAILEDLGYRHVREAGGGPEAVQAMNECGYDIVLMDLEMPQGDGDAGILAATKIKRLCPRTKIVLVTGNKPKWNSPAEAPDFLSGMISKPFDIDRMRSAMMQLRDTGSVGWPEVRGVLAEELPHGLEFIERISRTAHAARPLREILGSLLNDLKISTGACGVAIFGWNRSNKEVRMEAAVGVQTADFHYCQPHLQKSPVADLVYQPEQPIFYRDIDKHAEGKFLYLRPILGPIGPDGRWPLQSCMGEYLGEESDTVYTLFAFGDQVDQFKPEARILTRAAATVARAAIREHWIVTQVVSERRLTTLGGIVTSAAHELRGRLNALEAVASVERSWRQLRAHAEKLRDEEFVKAMEERIAGLRKAKQAMDNTVGKILGWVRTGEDSMVSVRVCLEKAVEACNDLAIKQKVRILAEYGFAPEIRANAVDLEQAFLNIVLNAILHIKGPNRPAGLLAIELKVADRTAGPIQVRFRDTGPGIHSRFLDKTVWGEERIFQPLFTTQKAGTGMGLYIVRGLLANHGGTVQVEKTAIWAGTTFLVELPFVKKTGEGDIQ